VVPEWAALDNLTVFENKGNFKGSKPKAEALKSEPDCGVGAFNGKKVELALKSYMRSNFLEVLACRISLVLA